MTRYSAFVSVPPVVVSLGDGAFETFLNATALLLFLATFAVASG